MITVIDFAKRTTKEGKDLFVLILQGGLDFVKSNITGKYATMKKCSISSPFDENTCKSLIGFQMPGSVQKVQLQPYDFTIKGTGEVIKLSHQWVYAKEGEFIEEKVIESAPKQPVFQPSPEGKFFTSCYIYSIAGPSEDYTCLKKKFISREGFIYLGKTSNG
jgi:hypothetical protein